VSEWFLLESLMQQFRVPGLGYRLVLALAGAAVALTVGFAGVTFARLVGLIVLGRGTESEPGRPGYGLTGRAAVLDDAAEEPRHAAERTRKAGFPLRPYRGLPVSETE